MWAFQDKNKAVSLLKWNYEVLAAFRSTEPHDEKKLNRYMRDRHGDNKTGPYKWTERCPKTGKKFYVWSRM